MEGVREFMKSFSAIYQTVASSDLSGSLEDIDLGPEVVDLVSTLERLASLPPPTVPILCRLKAHHRLEESLCAHTMADMEKLLLTVDFWDVTHASIPRIQQEMGARTLFEGQAEHSSGDNWPVITVPVPRALISLLMPLGRMLARITCDKTPTEEKAEANAQEATLALAGRQGGTARLHALMRFGARLDGDSEAMQLPTGQQAMADALALAALQSNFACCDRLVLACCPITPRLTNLCASFGCIAALSWAQDVGLLAGTAVACSSAAQGGHLAALQWLRAQGCPWNAQTCTEASRRGHLDVLQWAISNGCDDSGVMKAAAWGGRLDIIQWARLKGCGWGTGCTRSAARGGHLHVLAYLRLQGCPWDVDTCAAAAETGRLPVLQWVREQGCAWGKDVCTAAAAGRHLPLLQWAISAGCPWNKNVVLLHCGPEGDEGVREWVVKQPEPDAER